MIKNNLYLPVMAPLQIQSIFLNKAHVFEIFRCSLENLITLNFISLGNRTWCCSSQLFDKDKDSCVGEREIERTIEYR